MITIGPGGAGTELEEAVEISGAVGDSDNCNPVSSPIATSTKLTGWRLELFAGRGRLHKCDSGEECGVESYPKLSWATCLPAPARSSPPSRSAPVVDIHQNGLAHGEEE
jgi:hypothetical protein